MAEKGEKKKILTTPRIIVYGTLIVLIAAVLFLLRPSKASKEYERLAKFSESKEPKIS